MIGSKMRKKKGNESQFGRDLDKFVTEECLERVIAVCKDVALFRKIGNMISEHVKKFGYGIVDRFVRYGVGTVFHSEPLIFHHRNEKPGSMVAGQTFTIETRMKILNDIAAENDSVVKLDDSSPGDVNQKLMRPRPSQMVLPKRLDLDDIATEVLYLVLAQWILAVWAFECRRRIFGSERGTLTQESDISTGMGVESKNGTVGQSRDHKQPPVAWIYGTTGGADALSQETDALCRLL
ncbi:methionine aminopeptidase 1B, chloroplastic [Tanacetum coccineum]